ncbi:MAG: HAD-IA family hydrolase [Bacteroidia bacterium]|nr:HAD-IA family hydrolase [Bacteroidia bacterium]
MAKTFLIFDCDGVLVDSEILVTRIVLRMLAEQGVVMEESVFCQRYTGMMEADIFQDIEARYDVRLSDDFRATQQTLAHRAMLEELEAISGMPELVRSLETPRAVASNSTVPHVIHALERAGIRAVFEDRIFSSTHVARPKPAPDVYLHALQQLGLHPAEVLVIEDSLTGAAAARAAGLAVIGFLGAAHIFEGHGAALRALGVDEIAADAAELRQVLRKWGIR